MPKKTFTPEQIVGKLRQIEVLMSQGKTVPLACKDAGIVDQTYYRETACSRTVCRSTFGPTTAPR
jgi:hypothetical protein